MQKTRYSEKEIEYWKFLRGLCAYAGKSIRALNRNDLNRYVAKCTCSWCGRVFPDIMELTAHKVKDHIFPGSVEITDTYVIPDSIFIHPKKTLN
jgi:hypothetical protein